MSKQGRSSMFLKLQPKVEKLLQKIPLSSWSRPAAGVATGGRVSISAANGQVRAGSGGCANVPVKPDKPPNVDFEMLQFKIDIDRVMTLDIGKVIAESGSPTASALQQRMKMAEIWSKQMVKSIDHGIMDTFVDDLLNTKVKPEWRPKHPDVLKASSIKIQHRPNFSKP